MKLLVTNILLTLFVILLWILEAHMFPILESKSTQYMCVDNHCGNYTILLFKETSTTSSLIQFKTSRADVTIQIDELTRWYASAGPKLYISPIVGTTYHGDCAAPFYSHPTCPAHFYRNCWSTPQKICYGFSKLYEKSCLFGYDGLGCFTIDLHMAELFTPYRIIEASEEDSFASIRVLHNGTYYSITSEAPFPTYIGGNTYLAVSGIEIDEYDLSSNVLYDSADNVPYLIPKSYVCKFNPNWGCLGNFAVEYNREEAANVFVTHDDPELYVKVEVQNIWDDRFTVQTNNLYFEEAARPERRLPSSYGFLSHNVNGESVTTHVNFGNMKYKNIEYVIYSLNDVREVDYHVNYPRKVLADCVESKRLLRSACNITLETTSYGTIRLFAEGIDESTLCNISCKLFIVTTGVKGDIRACNSLGENCTTSMINVTYERDDVDPSNETVNDVTDWSKFINFIRGDTALRNVVRVLSIVLTILNILVYAYLIFRNRDHFKSKYNNLKHRLNRMKVKRLEEGFVKVESSPNDLLLNSKNTNSNTSNNYSTTNSERIYPVVENYSRRNAVAVPSAPYNEYRNELPPSNGNKFDLNDVIV